MAVAALEEPSTVTSLVARDEPQPAPQPSRRDRLAIPLLVLGMAVSNIGNNLTAIAAPWFVLVTTGSASRTGVVAATVAFATMLGGFFGGTVVDRIGFKRASIISDLASGFFIALIPTFYYLDMLTFSLLVFLVFMASLLDAPGWSARRSMLPELSRRVGQPLERSNSIVEIAHSGASFVGPLLGGVLITAMSVASVLYLDTLGFLISAGIIAVAITMPHTRTAPAADAKKQSIFHESTEGLRFMTREPLLRAMITVSLFANVVFTPLFGVAVPVYAKRVFDDPRALGVLIASFGVGALIGVLLYGAIGPRVRRYPVFVGGIVLGAASLWLLPATPHLLVSVLGTTAMGIGLGPTNVMVMTVLQEIVPEGLLGRVTGSLGAMSQMAAPLGLLLAGVAIDWFGVRPVMFFGAAMFSLIVAATISMPVFRRIERTPAASGTPATELS
ncbi:MAG: hypothetical protein DCC58_09610 [Chloroflexi bacterium]|nr:MAG: hypothetical protein DCC58_09610 [Chloroflexota bacterium]